jgi:hypothetical protein
MQTSTFNASECGMSLRRSQSGLKVTTMFLAGLALVVAAQPASGGEPQKIPMTAERWTVVAGTVNFVEHLGKPAIEAKAGDYGKRIPTGLALLKDMRFRNGSIEFDVATDAGMGAGVVFRRVDNDNNEMFYLRPKAKCEEAPDCVQYAPSTHGVLLWDVFPQYQGPAPVHMGEWNHVRLVISGKRMNIYVNGGTEPALRIGRLEGDADEGGLMLTGPGIFANLTVAPDAVEGLPSEPERDATESDDRYLRHWQMSPFSKLAPDQAPTYADLPAASAAWVPIDAERGGLVNVSRVYGMPGRVYGVQPDRHLVWLKTGIRSSTVQAKHVSLGWVREVFVFVNGQLVFADKNLYRPAEGRKTPDGRLSLENGSLILPLKAGDNELAVAVVSDFYGWGIKMRFDDVKDLLPRQ